MPRIVLISLLIVGLLVWAGFAARKNDCQTLSTILFTVAATYFLLSMAGFFGLIGG